LFADHVPDHRQVHRVGTARCVKRTNDCSRHAIANGALPILIGKVSMNITRYPTALRLIVPAMDNAIVYFLKVSVSQFVTAPVPPFTIHAAVRRWSVRPRHTHRGKAAADFTSHSLSDRLAIDSLPPAVDEILAIKMPGLVNQPSVGSEAWLGASRLHEGTGQPARKQAETDRARSLKNVRRNHGAYSDTGPRLASDYY
jgi:hypothetical protein